MNDRNRNGVGRSEVLGQYAANPPTPAPPGHSLMTSWCPACRRVSPVGVPPCQCVGYEQAHQWGVSAMEDRITAQFEQFVRARDRYVYKQTEREDPAEGAKMRRQYIRDFNEGLYNWADQLSSDQDNHVRSAVGKMWGALHLMHLLLVRCDPSVTEQLAHDICDSNPQDWLTAYFWARGIKPPEPFDPNLRTPPTVQSSGEKTQTAATFG